MTFRWLILAVVGLARAGAPAGGAEPSASAPAKAEFQKLDVKRYGVAIEMPADWKVVQEATEDRAFVALLEQGDPDRPGVVACEIAVPPADLKEYQQRIAAQARRGPAGRRLIHNEIKPVAGRHQLESIWEFQTRTSGVWRELKVRVLANDQLYTFTLNADAAHFDRHRGPFDTMARTARLAPPDTGLVRDAHGYVVQRRERFGMRLPEGWKPSFSPTEQVAFFAIGEVHEVFANSALIVANPPQELNFERLIVRVPEELKEEDPACRVLACKTVPQGQRVALETVVETERGPFKITVLERRFRGERGTYEVKFTVRSEDFERLTDPIRKSADSFKEFPK